MQINCSEYSVFNCIFVLGNGINYPISLESSLKLKELTYIFSQGYPIGELKHGPFALINNKTLIFILANTKDSTKLNKYVSTYEEIKTRGGYPVLICFKNTLSDKMNKIEIVSLK